MKKKPSILAIAAVTVLGLAAGGFAAYITKPKSFSVMSEANAQPASAKVGTLRAKYSINNSTVVEFSLSDGTPCVLTTYREVPTCWWGRYGWRN